MNALNNGCSTSIIIPHFTDEDQRLTKFRLYLPRSQLVSNRRGLTQIYLDSVYQLSTAG